jgi:hypothetical protein
MGYAARWTGQISITPPLSWAEIRSTRSPGLQDVKLRLDEQVEETPIGQNRIVMADAIVPITGGYYNGYAIEEQIQAVIDAHPSHEFTGIIEARPEDPDGTPWRYAVQGRRVVRQVPRLVWPDDSEVEQ